MGRAGPQILGLAIALVGLGEPGWAQSPVTAVELRPLVGETRLSPGDSLLRLPELKPEVLRDYLRRIEQERTLLPTGSVRLPSGPTLNAPAVTPVDPVQLLQTLRIDRSAPLLATRPEQVAIARTIALDLNQAYAVAQQNNPDLRIRQLGITQRQAELRRSFARFLPSLGLQGALGYSQFGSSVTVTDGNDFPAPLTVTSGSQGWLAQGNTSIGAVLALNYTVFDFQRGADYAAAIDQLTRAELDYRREWNDLQLRVAEAFYGLQRADQRLRVALISVEASLQVLGDNQALRRQGLGTRYDVLKQQVQMARDRDALVEAIADQDKARRDLAELLNVPPDLNLISRQPTQLALPWPLALPESIVRAYANRPELRALELSEQISLNRAAVARGRVLPSLNLQGSVGSSGGGQTQNYSGAFLGPVLVNAQTSSNYSFAVGLVLNFPFYDGGAAAAEGEALEVQAQIERESLVKLRNRIRNQVERAFYDLQSARSRVEADREAVERARLAFRYGRLRYQAGINTETDLLIDQRDLTEAEARLVESVIGYNLALSRLEQAVNAPGDRRGQPPS